MQPPNQHQRVNLAKLKAQIVKKLGPEGSKQYFYCFNRFLSLQLSRVEFNKLCIRIVGRENISLHNQFVRSILKNACAKVPPLTYDKEVPASVRPVGNKEHSSEEHKQSVPGLSNGYILPSSPRKARPGTHDRKASDRPSARGPNGKANFLKKLPDDSVSVHSKDQIETIDFENRKQVPSRSELCSPLGVPFFAVSVGGARKTTPVASISNCASSFTSGSLLDTATLRERMEQIAAAQGLEGWGQGQGMSQRRAVPNKHQVHLKLVNGVKPNYRIHSGNRPMEIMQERRPHHTTSLLDFRVAMELYPQQLGEDWPLLLEKICTQSFEE
ncbi:hypothetical protein Acr_16g0006050 [Actinidia rufa]|uniref:Transcriptional coactivator Hfi1/Transcriptional adapter 1 n=1 Tax=Actinidia rufa TaxID=165716 RepID=A0A7J0FZ55_9ERIC|nr:hypothetical protein Acr_16g0006050 [Actinidia rufa]